MIFLHKWQRTNVIGNALLFGVTVVTSVCVGLSQYGHKAIITLLVMVFVGAYIIAGWEGFFKGWE